MADVDADRPSDGSAADNLTSLEYQTASNDKNSADAWDTRSPLKLDIHAHQAKSFANWNSSFDVYRRGLRSAAN